MPKTRASSTPLSAKSNLYQVKYFSPESHSWECLTASISEGAAPEEQQQIEAHAKANNDQLKGLLLSSLQMQHVAVGTDGEGNGGVCTGTTEDATKGRGVHSILH